MSFFKFYLLILFYSLNVSTYLFFIRFLRKLDFSVSTTYFFKKRSKSKISEYEVNDSFEKNFNFKKSNWELNDAISYYLTWILFIILFIILLYVFIDSQVLIYFKEQSYDSFFLLANSINYNFFLNFKFISFKDFLSIFENDLQKSFKKVNFIFNFVYKSI